MSDNPKKSAFQRAEDLAAMAKRIDDLAFRVTEHDDRNMELITDLYARFRETAELNRRVKEVVGVDEPVQPDPPAPNIQAVSAFLAAHPETEMVIHVVLRFLSKTSTPDEIDEITAVLDGLAAAIGGGE